MNGRPLYRHPTDRQVGGVAAGVAAWLDIDPTIVRVAWILLAIFTSGLFLLVYFVMLLVVPLPPPGVGMDGRPLTGAPGGPGPWTSAPGGASGASSGAPGGWQPPDGRSWSPPPGGWKGPDPERAGIVGGVVLIALGAWFLVDRYVGIRIDWSLLWPVAILAVGVFLIVRASRRPPSA